MSESIVLYVKSKEGSLTECLILSLVAVPFSLVNREKTAYYDLVVTYSPYDAHTLEDLIVLIG